MKRWTGEKLYAVLTVLCFAGSVLAWKIAPSPRRSRVTDSRSRRLRFGLESRTVSALVSGVSSLIAKVAPHPPRWRGISFWSRRLRLGLENRAVSTSVARKWFSVAPYPP